MKVKQKNQMICQFILNLFGYYLFMQSDIKGTKHNEDVFKQMFKSSIRASYFNHMADNKFTNKSKLQINEIDQQQEVDQNTFRIMTGFVKPDDSFAVYSKKGRFYIEEEPFFSCIVSRKRYDLQLLNHKLRVSKSQSDTVQFFNFDTEQIEVTSKGSYFILKVQRCKKAFYFQPIEENAKQNIIDDWVSLLNKVIGVTLGKQKHFAYLPIKNQDFYCQQHVSNQQFQKSCNSLDIMLFKSQHSAARVQRVFTDSQYDHVGVVLRNRKNEIFIYESTSDEGVGLTPWKHMIKYHWYNSTDKIAWRRLNLILTKQDIATIQAFVAKTLGKQFSITLQKLFLISSSLKRSEEQQEKKTYFCSQLVARLYKELHLLDAERSSTRYYPVDFSQKCRIVLKTKEAYLEPERIIAFNR